jgi:SAM-dependent methyltransferase
MEGMEVTAVRRCRSCDQDALAPILSLGSTPLANALLAERDLACDEPTYPLDLYFCRACALVQIAHDVPPQDLFCEYPYFSSYSRTMLASAEAIATRLVAERALGANSLVVEIGSNDGYLLQFYRRAGAPVLGIDPAHNIAVLAEQRGIRTVCDFFGIDLARKLRAQEGSAAVLHANNVLGHVPDLNGVIAGIAHLLAEDGLAVVEAPYVRDLIERLEFDTIYHEHLCYFGVSALAALFGRHGLRIRAIERLPIHGGSLRIFLQPVAAGESTEPAGSGSALVMEERLLGMDREPYYQDFATRVAKLKGSLLATLADLKSAGHRIAGYGATAKGTTLMVCSGIDAHLIDFVVDRNPYKQGRFTPGTHLPILAPEALVDRMPEYCLLLAWNIADEILDQEARYRERGGRFIIPLPEVRVV